MKLLKLLRAWYAQRNSKQAKQSIHLKRDKSETGHSSKICDSETIQQKVDELLHKKTKLLHEYGVFTWKKSVLKKHREINEELEALGVFQGKKCFR